MPYTAITVVPCGIILRSAVLRSKYSFITSSRWDVRYKRGAREYHYKKAPGTWRNPNMIPREELTDRVPKIPVVYGPIGDAVLNTSPDHNVPLWRPYKWTYDRQGDLDHTFARSVDPEKEVVRFGESYPVVNDAGTDSVGGFTHFLPKGIRYIASHCPANWVDTLDWTLISTGVFTKLDLRSVDVAMVLRWCGYAAVREALYLHAESAVRQLSANREPTTGALPHHMAALVREFRNVLNPCLASESSAMTAILQLASSRGADGVDRTAYTLASEAVGGSYEATVDNPTAARFIGIGVIPGAKKPSKSMTPADRLFAAQLLRTYTLGLPFMTARSEYPPGEYSRPFLPLDRVVLGILSALESFGFTAFPSPPSIESLTLDMFLDGAAGGRPPCLDHLQTAKLFRRAGKRTVSIAFRKQTESYVGLPESAEEPGSAADYSQGRQVRALSASYRRAGGSSSDFHIKGEFPLLPSALRAVRPALSTNSCLDIEIMIGQFMARLALSPWFIKTFARHWSGALDPDLARDPDVAAYLGNAPGQDLAAPPQPILDMIAEDAALFPAFSYLDRLAYASASEFINPNGLPEAQQSHLPVPHVNKMYLTPQYCGIDALSTLAADYIFDDVVTEDLSKRFSSGIQVSELTELAQSLLEKTVSAMQQEEDFLRTIFKSEYLKPKVVDLSDIKTEVVEQAATVVDDGDISQESTVESTVDTRIRAVWGSFKVSQGRRDDSS